MTSWVVLSRMTTALIEDLRCASAFPRTVVLSFPLPGILVVCRPVSVPSRNCGREALCCFRERGAPVHFVAGRLLLADLLCEDFEHVQDERVHPRHLARTLHH